jgi:hypothetical protein
MPLIQIPIETIYGLPEERTEDDRREKVAVINTDYIVMVTFDENWVYYHMTNDTVIKSSINITEGTIPCLK